MAMKSCKVTPLPKRWKRKAVLHRPEKLTGDPVPGYHLLAGDRFDWPKINFRIRNVTRKKAVAGLRRDFIRAEAARLYLKGFLAIEIARELGLSRMYIMDCLNEAREIWRQTASADAYEARCLELAKIDALEHEYWIAYEQSKRKKLSRSIKYESGQEDAFGQDDGTSESAGALQSTDDPSVIEIPLPEQTPESILAKAAEVGVNANIKCRDKGATRHMISEAAQWQRLAHLVATEVTIKKDARPEGNPVFLAGIQWCIDARTKIKGLAAAQEIKLGGELRVAGVSPEQVDQQMLGILAERLRTVQLPQKN